MPLVDLALIFGVLSVLAIGGVNATIPEIHRQVVDIHHWMDDATFAGLVAIGQATPGPNVLIVSAIGWKLYGLVGLVVATLAMVLPAALLALGVGRLIAAPHVATHVGVLRGALAPIALGFMMASGYVMTQAAYNGALTLAIVLGVAALIVCSRVSPLWGIGAGAFVGLVAARAGFFGGGGMW